MLRHSQHLAKSEVNVSMMAFSKFITFVLGDLKGADAVLDANAIEQALFNQIYSGPV